MYIYMYIQMIQCIYTTTVHICTCLWNTTCIYKCYKQQYILYMYYLIAMLILDYLLQGMNSTVYQCSTQYLVGWEWTLRTPLCGTTHMFMKHMIYYLTHNCPHNQIFGKGRCCYSKSYQDVPRHSLHYGF